MTSSLNDLFQWFMSSPMVIETAFIWASILAILFSVIGYARREG